MGDASTDEFDQYDFSEFTADDFVAVDAVALRLSPSGTPTPDLGASASTRVEAPADAPHKVSRPYASKTKSDRKRKKRKTDNVTGASPFARYRGGRRTLSVSDLVGPSWYCFYFEVTGEHKLTFQVQVRGPV